MLIKYSDQPRKGILRRDIVFFILITIFLLASETWLFKADAFLKNVEFMIRFGAPLMLLLFFKKYHIPHKGGVVLCLYGILAAYTAVTPIFSENFNLVSLNIAKYLFFLLFLIALLLILRPSNFSYSFIYIPIYLGLLFSVQTIILFILIQTGMAPPSSVLTMVGYKNASVLSYGIWGYAQGMMGIGTALQVYRAQSFIGEPTCYAAFMLIPMILSYGLYRVRKEKKMLVIFILCALSFIISFSMTGYIVVFLTIFFNYIVTQWKKSGSLSPVITCILIFIATVMVIFYIQKATAPEFYSKTRTGMAFGHSPKELYHRINQFVDSWRLFRDHPFGIGYIAVEDSGILKNYPDAGGGLAPFYWLRIAGIVGFVTQIAIVIYLIKAIVIKQIKRFGSIERYIGLSFVAYTLHECVAGDWFNPMFFYMVALVIVTDAYQFSFFKVKLKHFIKRTEKTERKKYEENFPHSTSLL